LLSGGSGSRRRRDGGRTKILVAGPNGALKPNLALL
jgi:hypothetical protein